MDKRKRLEGMEMLIRALCGEENVIENMEKEGQNKAVRETLLPKIMKPEQEYWEELGFVFEEIEDDDIMCKGTLPEGWKLIPTDHQMWTNIVDQNNTKRGSMFYKAAFYDRKAHMNLKARYSVTSQYVDENMMIKEVYFGNENEKLFIAGTVYYDDNMTSEDLESTYEHEDYLINQATVFANTYYPDYTNPLAYWDNNTNQKGIARKKQKKDNK